MEYQSEVLFSIPGRIRIHVTDLDNDKTGTALRDTIEKLRGVISVQFNIRTHNILVLFQQKLIGADEIQNTISGSEPDYGQNEGDSFASPRQKQTKHLDTGIFRNERRLTRRLLRSVLLIGGLVFAFSLSIRQLIAILIFALPASLYIAPVSVFYFSADRLHKNKILTISRSSIASLEKTESLFIDDSLLLNDGNTDYRIGIADDPDRSVKNFIFGMRENGITDITAITGLDRQIIYPTANQLGIEKIIELKDGSPMPDFMQDHDMLVKLDKHSPRRDNGLPTCIYIACQLSNHHGKMRMRTIYCQIDQIPWLIEFSRHCGDIRVRCQNIAIAIHFLGILTAVLGYIGPIGALALYMLNIAWQPVIIKNRLLSYKKEIYYANQQPVCQ